MRPAWCRVVALRFVVAPVAALTLASTAPVAAVAESGARDPHAALRAVLDQVVREQGAPGALAQVWWAGRGSTISRGVADLRTGQRPRADMHFRIGSITKVFVATVVLQLVAEGRVRLADTLDRWLPGVVRGNGNNGHAITVRMLLNHTSGLFNYLADPRFNEVTERNRYLTSTPRDLVRLAIGHPPSFRPGTSWQYSNTNYVLLGMIIDRATGHSYATEITRRILRPLGLRETYLPGTSPDVRRPFMHGYAEENGRIEDVTRFNPSWAGAAGEMISTLGDLKRFYVGLLTGGLLPAALLRQMLTPTPESDVAPGHGLYRYGLGIMMTTLPCGVTVYGHGGSITGSASWVAGTRDGRHVVAYDLNALVADRAAVIAAATVAEFCPSS